MEWRCLGSVPLHDSTADNWQTPQQSRSALLACHHYGPSISAFTHIMYQPTIIHHSFLEFTVAHTHIKPHQFFTHRQTDRQTHRLKKNHRMSDSSDVTKLFKISIRRMQLSKINHKWLMVGGDNSSMQFVCLLHEQCTAAAACTRAALAVDNAASEQLTTQNGRQQFTLKWSATLLLS